MKKKTTFLYGLGEKKDYEYLSAYFNIPKIDWNKGTITPRIRNADTLIGFSLGCMLAIMHVEKHKVKNLILCSPTPGEETLKDIKADNIIILVGEKEDWVKTDLIRLMNTATCPLQILTIPNTGHKITKNYIDKLLQIVEFL